MSEMVAGILSGNDFIIYSPYLKSASASAYLVSSPSSARMPTCFFSRPTATLTPCFPEPQVNLPLQWLSQ